MNKNVLWGSMVAIAIVALAGWFIPSQQIVDEQSLRNYVDRVIEASVATFAGTTNYDALVINEEGADEDSRFETDTNTHAIFLDAGNDVVTVDGFTDGSVSGCFSTSTTGTLTQANLLANSCIEITATGAGQGTIALTLPATSTMTTLLANEGECRRWFIDADAVAAATTTTITAGTGHVLVGLDATGAGTGADVLDGNEYGWMQMCKKDDTDVVTFITEWIHAD